VAVIRATCRATFSGEFHSYQTSIVRRTYWCEVAFVAAGVNVLVWLFIAAEDYLAPAENSAARRLSAAEEFRLRGECGALSKNIAGDHTVRALHIDDGSTLEKHSPSTTPGKRDHARPRSSDRGRQQVFQEFVFFTARVSSLRISAGLRRP
jgi:hypothetical protein